MSRNFVYTPDIRAVARPADALDPVEEELQDIALMSLHYSIRLAEFQAGTERVLDTFRISRNRKDLEPVCRELSVFASNLGQLLRRTESLETELDQAVSHPQWRNAMPELKLHTFLCAYDSDLRKVDFNWEEHGVPTSAYAPQRAAGEFVRRRGKNNGYNPGIWKIAVLDRKTGEVTLWNTEAKVEITYTVKSHHAEE